MASSLPIIRQTAWLSLVPQIAVMAALVFAASALGVEQPPLAGIALYLVLLFTLRTALPRHHRRGMKLFKRERFADAIPEFRRSYEFFERYPWVDRWRALTVLSSSHISYREMALLNLALCLAQTGQVEEAIAEYQRTLVEFPGSKVAKMALRMLESKAT
jgi:tetratricopeptide (TPR) repeat protein